MHREAVGNDPHFVDDRCLGLLIIGILNRELFILAKETSHPFALSKPDVYLEQCEQSFKSVFEIGVDIVLDHYLVSFARYEFGKLFVHMKNFTEAKYQFSLVGEGGWPKCEVPDTFKKAGKISLENMLNFRVHNALAKMQRLELGDQSTVD
jgi:hypothetical protein